MAVFRAGNHIRRPTFSRRGTFFDNTERFIKNICNCYSKWDSCHRSSVEGILYCQNSRKNCAKLAFDFLSMFRSTEKSNTKCLRETGTSKTCKKCKKGRSIYPCVFDCLYEYTRRFKSKLFCYKSQLFVNAKCTSKTTFGFIL